MKNFVVFLSEDGVEYSTLWKGETYGEVLESVMNSFNEKDFKKVEWIRVHGVIEGYSAEYKKV